MIERKGIGCLKIGCFGCLSIIVLCIGAVLLLGAAQMADSNPQPEEVRAEHQLPGTFPSQDGPEESPRSVELDDALPRLDAPPSSGRLEIEFEMGELIIRPGPPGEPMRIQADYDAKAYRLTEEMTEDSDGNWVYRVKFTGEGGWLDELFGNDGRHNRIEITVPQGVPLDLVGEIAKGRSDLDLSGLWLRTVDLETAMGEHFIEFREPSPEPLERFEVTGAMGDLEIQNLGEAGPRKVDLNHAMGNLLLDLDGTWRENSDVSVEFTMGNCRILVPQNARLLLGSVDVDMGNKSISYDKNELGEGVPEISLRASGSMGRLDIED